VDITKEHQALTSATRQVRSRMCGMVFGGHLSAQAAIWLDPADDGPAVRPCMSFLCYSRG